MNLKKILALILVVGVTLGWTYKATVQAKESTEIEYIDGLCTDTQRLYIQEYAGVYNLSEEVIQSLIFNESRHQMDAVNVNTGCYGIAQINPKVWGYGYDSEKKQIQKCCEMIYGYLMEEPDIAFAIARYNGQSSAYSDYENGLNTEDEFVSKVLRIAEELEYYHGKREYENETSEKGYQETEVDYQ